MAIVNKTMHKFNVVHDGDTNSYEIVDKAGRKMSVQRWEDNSAKAFTAGEYIEKDGKFYKFKTNHTAGSAWSASEVVETNIGSELTDLKSALSVTKDGINRFVDTLKADLSRGTFANGAYNPANQYLNLDYKYRVSSITAITFPYAVTLTIATGFKVIPYLYQNGTWMGQGWKTGSYSVTANTPFYIQITRTTEDSSEIADINEFVSKVEVTGNPVIMTKDMADSIYDKITDAELRDYIDTSFENYGVDYIPGKWSRGLFNPATGSFSDGYQYRISLTEKTSFKYFVELKIDSGFRIYPYLYQNNQWTGQGWKTGSYIVPTNTEFYCQIARDPDNTSEIADVKTFLSKVKVHGAFAEIQSSDYENMKKSLSYKYSDFEYGGWYSEGGTLVKKSDGNDRIRSRRSLPSPQCVRAVIKQSGTTVYLFCMNDNDEYVGSIAMGNTVGTFRATFDTRPTYTKSCIIIINSAFTSMPADPSEYVDIYFENDQYVASGKNLYIYHFGGNPNGNDWCFVRTPVGYNQFRDRPYPFVICNHGNGWVMDGTEEKANWTKRTMYIPSTDPDAGSDQYNVTDDSSLWYSNPTIEALLTAGYVVCGCENYGDNLYGNNHCRNACVDFFNHMVKRYNVTDYCYMIGASNGAMTSLNAAYLLQGKVKAMILQYPLTCLFNQYKHPGDDASGHPAAIRSAYGISNEATDEQVIKAIATHDPLTVDVIDGKKVGVFPPTKLYYSEQDTVVQYQYNAVALATMLENSNKVVALKKCSGGHGDKSMFVPSEFVAWFAANT